MISVIVALLVISLETHETLAGRGRGRGKARTSKILIQYPNAKEFNMLAANGTQDHRSPQIVRASHFLQGYRLGGKIVLICAAQGEPRPRITWFKDMVELVLKENMHLYERILGENQMWSKIEIDPATFGDQGIFICIAQNSRGNIHRNYRVEMYS